MPTRSSRPQPDYRRRRMVLGGGVITLALLVGALGTWAWGRYGNVDRVDVDLAAVSKEGPSNYLVVGSDTRDGIGADEAGAGAFLDTGEDQTGHRSDTLMVVRPPALMQRVADAVEANLGVPINHYVEVDFIAFQRLVEAVGGVPIYASSPVRDRNSGLNIEQAGCITLDPYQALAFSRARHLEYQKPDGSWATDPTGDLGRVTRQQIFMRRSLGQVSQLNLTDIGALDTLGTTLTETVTLDQDLSLRTLIALGKRFKDFSPDDLATTVVPTTDRTMPSGAQVQMLDEAAAPAVLAPFRGDAPQGAAAAAILPGGRPTRPKSGTDPNPRSWPSWPSGTSSPRSSWSRTLRSALASFSWSSAPTSTASTARTMPRATPGQPRFRLPMTERERTRILVMVALPIRPGRPPSSRRPPRIRSASPSVTPRPAWPAPDPGHPNCPPTIPPEGEPGSTHLRTGECR